MISRTTALVAGLDEEYENRNILLFAHGDVLQILQTAVLKVDGRGHRGLEHLDTAVVKELVLGGGEEVQGEKKKVVAKNDVAKKDAAKKEAGADSLILTTKRKRSAANYKHDIELSENDFTEKMPEKY